MYTATADYPHVGLNYELKVFGFLYDSARSIVSDEKKISERRDGRSWKPVS